MSKWICLFLCISKDMVVVVLYSIGAISSCKREREREKGVLGFLEGLGVEFKVGYDKRKGEKNIGREMSVVVVVCGLWFTFQIYFSPPTLWCKFR